MPLRNSLLNSPPLPATGPDAEIIARCNHFAALEISRYAPDYPEDGYAWDSDFEKARNQAYDAMLEGRATTLEGFLARARAAALYIEPNEHGEWHWTMVESLLEDMLKLPVEG